MTQPYSPEELIEQLSIPEPTLDSETVIAVSSRASEIRENIRHGFGTMADIKNWYVQHDPMAERLLRTVGKAVMSQDIAAHHDILRNMSADTLTLIRGGSLLAMTTILPQFASHEDTVSQAETKVNEHWEKVICPMLPNGTSDAPNLQASLNIELLLRAEQEHAPLEQSNLEDLFLAAEMLDDGARQMRSFFLIDDQPLDDSTTLAFFSKIAANNIYEQIMAFGSKPADSDGSPMSLRSMRTTIDAAILRCDTMGRAIRMPEDAISIDAKNQFYIMSLMLRTMFDGNAADVSKLVRSPEISGKLHEAIWLLDSFVSKQINPKELGNITVSPSRSRCDRPELDGPKLRRGYDYELVGLQDSRLIQLKKSGQLDQQPYHPTIDLVIERNFMDIQPKRLQRKLNLYLEWAQRNFDSTYADEFKLYDAYVLESVKDVMGSLST